MNTPQVELLDEGPDGWNVYHLAVRGVKYDTIRVGRYDNVDYRVEAWRQNGWTHLLSGVLIFHDDPQRSITTPYDQGVERAIKVLFAP